MTNKTTFTESVEVYLSQADYLTDADKPLITALQAVAEELDAEGVTAALVNVFGVTMRSLQKRAGAPSNIPDPQTEFLDSL